VSAQQAKRLRRLLAALSTATSPLNMNIAGYQLHLLAGKRKGEWAVSVSGNWRLVFSFDGENATDVDLVDYHSGKEKAHMDMHNPPHPGEIVREDCLKALDLTVTQAAKGLGVTRKTLSSILNGRSGVSAEMALRLSKAFGSTPEHWLQMQLAYDLWQAKRRAKKLHVKKFFATAAD
jgi:addiction module HigA family antidote